MVKAGQNLSFVAEAADDLFILRACVQQLYGDLLPELAIGAFGQPDHAHPAAPDFAQQPVMSDVDSAFSR
jgi:hypothetical protein